MTERKEIQEQARRVLHYRNLILPPFVIILVDEQKILVFVKGEFRVVYALVSMSRSISTKMLLLVHLILDSIGISWAKASTICFANANNTFNTNSNKIQ